MKYRKPTDPDLFARAESYLQTELLVADEAELLAAYHAARAGGDDARALERLVELGDRQGCSNPYWQVLERLAAEAWPTRWMVDRRAKGQREARIEYIQQRARGQAAPGAAADRGLGSGS